MPKVGERHELVVTYAITPDDVILCVHSDGWIQSQSWSSPKSLATRSMVKTA